jgi:glycosyltransferase involved in cell wall biosynthesis
MNQPCQGKQRALMIAFHYPPYQGSSGVLRTLNFTKYLPEFGWEPLVLTANVGVYAVAGDSNPQGLNTPTGTTVTRALALDAARHLSIRGRYPSWLALPDRWASWSIPAALKALSLIRKYRPALIWSTYPIATAHLIGWAVHRATGLPWIADFRDSMTEEGYPHDRRQRQAYRWIENKTVHAANRVVFTTPGTARMYAERYPQIAAPTWTVIQNGYDEETFSRVERRSIQNGPQVPTQAPGGSPERSITLLHSGVLYPSERDPQPFLQAIANLKALDPAIARRLRVVFRATSHDAVIGPMLARFGVEDVVRLEPPIPYELALEEMLKVDALLLFQAANCNHQIPAKLYEYLRTGKPIFALTDHDGDTAHVLRNASVDTIADLANAADIQTRLGDFMRMLEAGVAPTASRAVAAAFSRRNQAAELSRLMYQQIEQSI